MEPLQNTATEVAEIDQTMAGLGKEPVDFLITLQQQAWIDYNALNGLITDILEERVDSEGKPLTMRKMTIKEFAAMLGVDRDTLRRWRTTIPNFWERVNARRVELAPQSRLAILHERWYLNAMKFNNWPVTEAWMINFDPNYKTPKVKIEHDITNNYAALLAAAAKDGVIEGGVVDAKPIDASASPSD